MSSDRGMFADSCDWSKQPRYVRDTEFARRMHVMSGTFDRRNPLWRDGVSAEKWAAARASHRQVMHVDDQGFYYSLNVPDEYHPGCWRPNDTPGDKARDMAAFEAEKAEDAARAERGRLEREHSEDIRRAKIACFLAVTTVVGIVVSLGYLVDAWMR